MGLFQRVWLVWIVFYCIVMYIENLGIDERKSFGGKLGAGSEEKKKGKELIAPGDYCRLFNVRWLACFRSRSLSLFCKTTRRREVETFIGFHDSTSEYASD